MLSRIIGKHYRKREKSISKSECNNKMFRQEASKVRLSLFLPENTTFKQVPLKGMLWGW